MSGIASPPTSSDTPAASTTAANASVATEAARPATTPVFQRRRPVRCTVERAAGAVVIGADTVVAAMGVLPVLRRSVPGSHPGNERPTAQRTPRQEFLRKDQMAPAAPPLGGAVAAAGGATVLLDRASRVISSTSSTVGRNLTVRSVSS